MKLNLKSLDHCADAIAREIMSRATFDLSETKLIIAMRFKMLLPDILDENSKEVQNEYDILLEKAKKVRLGSPEYTMLGYELARAKANLKKSNRLLNHIKKQKELDRLKDFVTERFGATALEGFIEEEINS